VGNFLEELKRRHVIRVGLAYLVVGWIIIQFVDVVGPTFDLPDWFLKVVLLLLIIGLPLALLMAWALDLTPEGIKTAGQVEEDGGAHRNTGRKLDFIIIGALVLALGYFAWDKFNSGADPELLAVSDKSIAVLPFVSMSKNEDDEFFSDGLTEELLNVLAQNKQLKVAGRTSSFYYKGKSPNLQEVGRNLNVAHILEGSVRRSGTRLRITAQLISVEDGFHLWSETFEREFDDIFVIQDEIANAVYAALEAEFFSEVAGSPVPASAPLHNSQAHGLYLVATAKLKSDKQTEVLHAEALFKQVLEIEPNHAGAYVGLAKTAIQKGFAFLIMASGEAEAAAGVFVDKALALAPDLSDALAIKGQLARFEVQRTADPETIAAAMDFLERAIASNPNSAEAHFQHGRFQEAVLNDFPAALNSYERAIHIDPLDRDQQLIRAILLRRLDREAEARSIMERMIDLYPDYMRAILFLADLEFEAGRLDDSLLYIERAVSAAPDNPLMSLGIAASFYDMGDKEAAVAALKGVKADGFAEFIRIAISKIILEETDELKDLYPKWLAEYDDRNVKNLAAGMALRFGDWETATDILMERAPALFDPDDPEITDANRGWVPDVAYLLKNTGRARQAEKLLRGALPLYRPEPGERDVAFFNLARMGVYAMLGEEENALAEFQAAYAKGQRSLLRPNVSSYWLLPLDQSPYYGDFLNHPGFKAIIAKMKAANAAALIRYRAKKAAADE
jgi:TolB-like protein/cytochrome c-type biogenesis protein CcmH/NrfG